MRRIPVRRRHTSLERNIIVTNVFPTWQLEGARYRKRAEQTVRLEGSLWQGQAQLPRCERAATAVAAARISVSRAHSSSTTQE
eukprot:3616229-Heterocapsa_arctica.AAC.1